jgi:hypothetical protein
MDKLPVILPLGIALLQGLVLACTSYLIQWLDLTGN